jgi:serine phosphatase RsbU (regulator of sigma subunit)
MDPANQDPQIIELDKAAVSLLPGEPAYVAASGEHSSNIIPLTEELRSAGRIQRSLLPSHFPALTGWEVSGACLAAGPIGGDFYDIQQLPNSRTLFLVADVMGKGIPAALIASVLRAVVRNVAPTASGPAEILARVNQLIYEDLSNAEMFVTAQAACLDLKNGVMEIASAGHCPLLLRTRNGIESIAPAGIPIGVSPRASYAEETVPAAEIEMILMYTDGVTESRNKRGESFGIERLENWFSTAPASTASVLKESFAGLLETFQGSAKARDDQTFLIFTRSY